MSKTIRQLWRDEFSQEGFCILCGNTGEVAVTYQIPSGARWGEKKPCICPNGRSLKTGIVMGTERSSDPLAYCAHGRIGGHACPWCLPVDPAADALVERHRATDCRCGHRRDQHMDWTANAVCRECGCQKFTPPEGV